MNFLRCRLFRRDRQGKRGEGVALYIKKRIQCEELYLKNGHKQVESLWLRIRDRGNREPGHRCLLQAV